MKRRGLFLSLLATIVMGSTTVWALDYNDVLEMVRNQVPESTITNMVQSSDQQLAFTADQVVALQ